ncbi:MAG: hypothetical protein WKG06_21040 [Segetibacter sp.]
MKLALIALAIEICLARIFAGSWVRAEVIVVLYCLFVYARQKMLIKKQNKDKPPIETKDTLMQDYMDGKTKSEKKLYHVYPTIGAIQKN